MKLLTCFWKKKSNIYLAFLCRIELCSLSMTQNKVNSLPKVNVNLLSIANFDLSDKLFEPISCTPSGKKPSVKCSLEKQCFCDHRTIKIIPCLTMNNKCTTKMFSYFQFHKQMRINQIYRTNRIRTNKKKLKLIGNTKRSWKCFECKMRLRFYVRHCATEKLLFDPKMSIIRSPHRSNLICTNIWIPKSCNDLMILRDEVHTNTQRIWDWEKFEFKFENNDSSNTENKTKKIRFK